MENQFGLANVNFKSLVNCTRLRQLLRGHTMRDNQGQGHSKKLHRPRANCRIRQEFFSHGFSQCLELFKQEDCVFNTSFIKKFRLDKEWEA